MLADVKETAEHIRGILAQLVAERQRLRATGDEIALAANKLAIAYWQQELAELVHGDRPQ